MEQVLTAALSPDNEVRRTAEEHLSYATGQRGFAVALAERLSKAPATLRGGGGAGRATDDGSGIESDNAIAKRLMAGVLLQNFVRDHWEQAGYAVLPPDDKAQVSSIVLGCAQNSLTFFWQGCR